MMNSAHVAREAGSDAGVPADAESKLQMTREMQRQRLVRVKNNGGGPIEDVAHMAPLARQFVREHPYASLCGAALAGVWLMRRKPWRAPGGSLLASLLARQTLALSLSAGSQLLKGLTAAARSTPVSNLKP